MFSASVQQYFKTRGRTSPKNPPRWLVCANSPEIECSHVLVYTEIIDTSHVNKNGGSQERNIQIKIVVKCTYQNIILMKKINGIRRNVIYGGITLFLQLHDVNITHKPKLLGDNTRVERIKLHSMGSFGKNQGLGRIRNSNTLTSNQVLLQQAQFESVIYIVIQDL